VIISKHADRIPATNSSKIPDASVFSAKLPDFYCVGFSTFTFSLQILTVQQIEAKVEIRPEAPTTALVR
jgi:hypothetical protein